MLTTTRVEAIVIDSDDGSSTFFRNDGDLVIDLKRGRALGDQLGAVLVTLGIDDHPSLHEVRMDAYSPLGSPIEVLSLAREQLTTAKNALQRIQDGEDINDLGLGFDVEGAKR